MAKIVVQKIEYCPEAPGSFIAHVIIHDPDYDHHPTMVVPVPLMTQKERAALQILFDLTKLTVRTWCNAATETTEEPK